MPPHPQKEVEAEMPYRKLLLAALVSALFATAAPSANATVFTGTCVLDLQFQFSDAIRSARNVIGVGHTAQAVTTYDITATSAADMDPTKAGSQACTMDVTPLDPSRETAAWGSGQALSWTCEATAGTGSWHQDFYPDPASVTGSHAIGGTWGNWVMFVNNQSLNFTGTINLTVAPSDAAKLAQCETTGITDLRMTGVMHLQDPEV
jgi:hypothetical protein